MNANFVGAADAQDLKALIQLRQSLIPMITVMNNLKVDMEFRMSRGEAVDWPQIHSATTNVSNYLAALSGIIHGGQNHIVRALKKKVPTFDSNGNPLLAKDGSAILRYKPHGNSYVDVPIEAQHDRLKALHPVPVAPFPIGGAGANLAATMLRKRLEPNEEEWVEARIRKATEFAHVPSEWGIEAKKSDEKAKSEDKDEEDDEDAVDDKGERLHTKRTKSPLTEDDLVTLWQYAHQEAFDKRYILERYPHELPNAGQEEEEEEGSEEEGESGSDAGSNEGEEEEGEEEVFEDVMDTTGSPAAADDQASKEQKPPSAPAKPMRKVVTRPQVHEAIPGLPVLPLGFVHKFMTTGESGGQ